MDPVEELVALEAIKKVKHQYAHNLDRKQLDERHGGGADQRAGDRRARRVQQQEA